MYFFFPLPVFCFLSVILIYMRKLFAIFVVAFSFSFFFQNTELVFAEQTREQLEADLANLESQIKELTNSITQTKQQGTNLKSEIKRLEGEIATRKNLIQTKSKVISRLSSTISEKNKTINLLDAKIDREKESLAQIMRKTRYLEQYSILDFGLQSGSLSTFFLMLILSLHLIEHLMIVLKNYGGLFQMSRKQRVNLKR